MDPVKNKVRVWEDGVLNVVKKQTAESSQTVWNNKKVLLRERKRHTARRVVSTPSVVLPGYPPPGGGYPVRYPRTPRGGYPVPPLGGGYPDPPHCPMAFWEMLQSIMGYGYPPPGVDRQTKWNYYLPVVLRTRAVIIYLRMHFVIFEDAALGF